MRKVINVSIILLTAILIGFVFIMSLLPNRVLDIEITLGCFILPIIIIFITMIVQIKKNNVLEEKNKIRKFWLSTLFIIYCLLMIVVLFLNNTYRRYPGIQNINPFSIEHLKTINIIPFSTITNHIIGIVKNSSTISIINIIINLILFAPMGFFVPLLFNNKIKNNKNFIILISIITIVVEILQYITCRGSTDIDDIILNTIGAFVIYMLMKLKLVKRLLNKTFDLKIT